jgi:hypothetical protein
VAFASVSTLLKCLKPCPEPMATKLVMERILSHSLLQSDLPDYVLPQKDAMAQSQILEGLNKTLAENRSCNSIVKFVVKQTMLIAVVSGGVGQILARVIDRALEVHHQNVTSARLRRQLFDTTCTVLWTLSVKKGRSDAISPLITNIIHEHTSNT